MAVQDIIQFNQYLHLQNRTLDIYGQPCTIFIPDNYKVLGYEDSSIEKADTTGVNYLGCHWRKVKTTCWLDFSVEKSVLYRWNFFPEDQDSLIFGLFKVNADIRDECFIRTTVPGQTSIWGDVLLKIINMKDRGMFQTLHRAHFLRAYVSNELNELFQGMIDDPEGWEAF